MTAVCTVCGEVNSSEAPFCESCGNPLQIEVASPNSENLVVPDIALGYASNLDNKPENRDGFLIFDATSLFSEDKHRRILCIIVKGLSKFLDPRILMNKLSTEIISQKKDIDYQKVLLDVKNYLNKEHILPFSGNKEKSETGVLVSILDNRQVNTLCIDAPRAFILNEDKTIQMMEGTKTNPVFQSDLIKNGAYICMCSSDLDVLLSKDEIAEAIIQAYNPQLACNTIMTKINSKEPKASFSISIAQILS